MRIFSASFQLCRMISGEDPLLKHPLSDATTYSAQIPDPRTFHVPPVASPEAGAVVVDGAAGGGGFACAGAAGASFAGGGAGEAFAGEGAAAALAAGAAAAAASCAGPAPAFFCRLFFPCCCAGSSCGLPGAPKSPGGGDAPLDISCASRGGDMTMSRQGPQDHSKGLQCLAALHETPLESGPLGAIEGEVRP